ncbi:hypothetical protein [Halorussus salinisoli]|nr:hypothetical protein [Halorussus salinisoli]
MVIVGRRWPSDTGHVETGDCTADRVRIATAQRRASSPALAPSARAR